MIRLRPTLPFIALLIAATGCDVPLTSEDPDLGDTAPTPTMLEQITRLASTPARVEFTRVDTSPTTLQLVAYLELSPSLRLRLELVPDLRAPEIRAALDTWSRPRPVAITWEGTFEHLTVDGAPVAIGVDELGTTLLDPEVRTLCGETQRVRANAWIELDGFRARALVSFGFEERTKAEATSAAVSAPGNCQIRHFLGYSWCEGVGGVENGRCSFVQQVEVSSRELCLAGRLEAEAELRDIGAGGSASARGTWGTVTTLTYATFAGQCVHVDGWLSDSCECRATRGPTFTTATTSCAAGDQPCQTPQSCPG